MRISDWSSDVCSSELDGTAVLNADDPRVMAMADRFAGNIITFGLAEQAALRAEQVRSAWPERLSFTAIYQGHAVEITTKLCGTHWTIGRASCRERVGQYGSITVVAGTLKKKQK